eukprot:TRINITY_DN23735_c0_g2_i4.p1 TRINITY_DN23735_c0_g2~~TRINITY_DN23735_c0_g2_i4.p1  ORF type:complete len:119 (-),score=35.08 TRINITY_DN23735_c0_g2_i4:44-400(-)
MLYLSVFFTVFFFFFFQAEDGIRDAQESRGLGDVYKRQHQQLQAILIVRMTMTLTSITTLTCLLYTSDAADEEDSVDLGGRRIIKKKKKTERKMIMSIKDKKKKYNNRASDDKSGEAI